ncbi:hypothetical protein D3C78_1524990 [compost metagenome]
MVTDNRRNLHIQAAVSAFHQQVAQAMRFFGHQHHNTTTAGVMQFADRTHRQCAIEIRQQSSVVKNAFQLGTHKEAASTVINEFIVLNNVEFMFVTNIGDLGDQTFGIRTNGAQNFSLYILVWHGSEDPV